MSRFPITVWPGPLDVVPWGQAKLLRTPGGFWDEGLFEEGESYHLPPEFYLREVMDVDLMSADSVATFVEMFGFLLFGGYDDRWVVTLDTWQYPSAFDGWPDRFSEQLLVTMEERYRGDIWQEWQAARDARFGEGKPIPQGTPLMYELLIESRAGLAVLRDLSRLVQNWRRNRLRSLPKTWDLSLFGVGPPKDAEEAFAFMVGAINGPLSGISARLLTAPDPRVGATVYVAAVAQMFNHIADGVSYKFCASQTCRRAFVHQVDGVSEYGQYRSRGVLYCSNRCARAQAQREYRKRRKNS